MRNNAQKIAFKPRSALDLAASNAAYYTCRENAGTTLTDILGNHADIALVGTAATPLSSNPGWITPNGTDTYAVLPPELEPDFTRTGNAWVFACRFYRAADASATECLVGIGDFALNGSIFGFGIAATGACTLISRGIDATASTTNAFPDFDMTAYNATAGVDLAFVVRRISDTNISSDLWVDGAYYENRVRNLFNDGGTGFPASSDNGSAGPTICARRGLSIAELMKSGSSAARISNILVIKQDTYDSNAVAKILAEHHRYPGEKPRSLL